MGAGHYPTPVSRHLDAIDETVLVYEQQIRLERDVRAHGARTFPPELTDATELIVNGILRYQACDAKTCYFPTSVPLRWTFRLRPHDLVRVPDSIRRGSR